MKRKHIILINFIVVICIIAFIFIFTNKAFIYYMADSNYLEITHDNSLLKGKIEFITDNIKFQGNNYYILTNLSPLLIQTEGNFIQVDKGHLKLKVPNDTLIKFSKPSNIELTEYFNNIILEKESNEMNLFFSNGTEKIELNVYNLTPKEVVLNFYAHDYVEATIYNKEYNFKNIAFYTYNSFEYGEEPLKEMKFALDTEGKDSKEFFYSNYVEQIKMRLNNENNESLYFENRADTNSLLKFIENGDSDQIDLLQTTFTTKGSLSIEVLQYINNINVKTTGTVNKIEVQGTSFMMSPTNWIRKNIFGIINTLLLTLLSTFLLHLISNNDGVNEKAP